MDDEITIQDILQEIGNELERAMARHSPMASHHEAYAVILEEIDEYWDEVKRRQPSKWRLREELLQIASMAIRAIYDLHAPNYPGD